MKRHMQIFWSNRNIHTILLSIISQVWIYVIHHILQSVLCLVGQSF